MTDHTETSDLDAMSETGATRLAAIIAAYWMERHGLYPNIRVEQFVAPRSGVHRAAYAVRSDIANLLVKRVAA